MDNIRCLLIFTSRGIKIRNDDGRLKSIDRSTTKYTGGDAPENGSEDIRKGERKENWRE